MYHVDLTANPCACGHGRVQHYRDEEWCTLDGCILVVRARCHGGTWSDELVHTPCACQSYKRLGAPADGG